MTDRAPALATTGEAKDLLGDEFEELVSIGAVRRVRDADGVKFVGADIDRAIAGRNPRSLAQRVGRIFTPGGTK